MPTPSSSEAVAFNGGTITSPLTIQPDETTTPLIIQQDAVTTNQIGLLVLAGLNGQQPVGFYGPTNSGIEFYAGAGRPLGLEVQSEATSTIARFGDGHGNQYLQLLAAGAAVFRAHAAPADGTLAAGDLALWFDQTDGVGNTKAMFKGKSADGTVKTASVLLA